MNKTRLTNDMRRKTCDRLLAATFRERELRLDQRERALALRVLRRELGEDVLIRIAALPLGWLPMVDYLQFANYSIARGNIRRPFGGYSAGSILRLPEAMFVPSFVSQHRLDVSPESIAEIEAFVADFAALHEERESLIRQVIGTLGGFYTVEEFAEKWPDGYAHFPHPEMAPETLPAYRIEDLNARIASAREAA